MRETAVIPAFVLGFGFMRAWALTFLSKSGVALPLAMLTEGTLLVFAPLLFATMAFAYVGSMRRGADLLSRRALVTMAAMLMAGSCMLGVGTRATLLAGEALCAVGFGLLLLQWGIASSCISHRRLMVSLVWGFVLAGALCLVSSFVGPQGRLVMFAAYAPATAVCLAFFARDCAACEGKVAYALLGTDVRAQGRWADGGRSLLARMAVAMFAMELVARSTLMLSGEYCVRILNQPAWSFELARFLGTLFSLLVFYGLLRRSAHPLRALYALVPSALVCSCLFAYFGGLGMPYVTYTIAFTAGAWLETVFWVFFSHSCTAVGRPPLLVWAAGRVAFWVSTFVGIALWSAQSWFFADGIVNDTTALTSLVVFMSLGVVLVYTLVLPGETVDRISIMRDRELQTHRVFEDRGQALGFIADRSGLSPREREVFSMLAYGRDTAYIQEHLVISAGTVRSHRDRIYRKLGIHSRQELLDLVEREMSDPSQD